RAARLMTVHPQTGHVHLLSLDSRGQSGATLVELTQSGALIAARPFVAFSLQDPQAMVFAPSADLTDDPGVLNLYIAGAGPGDSVREFTLTPSATPAVAGSPSVVASLVRITDMSQFSPP